MILPKSCAQDLSIPFVLCTKITTALSFVQPTTGKVGVMWICEVKTVVVTGISYNKKPFNPLLHYGNLKEFTVLDVQLDDPSKAKTPLSEGYAMADVEVIRSDDFGVTDETVIVRSHLGGILEPGMLVMGYDLRRSSINNDEYEKYLNDMPDVILVCRAKDPEQKKKKRRRVFREIQETSEVNEKEIEAYERERDEYLEYEEDD